ncbi:MAG: bifunctional UDP-N-acetylmuramoyl-tripeptide:D-alanyl-D-alanine ligase/alanine racemase [Bacteroidales bacterium]|nr:bifunctional UDP-N-acetylmuramoyl-tripeptide:D-alanyl-D-alanine ligase/alanine racemase [Bacteroidales bacterium]
MITISKISEIVKAEAVSIVDGTLEVRQLLFDSRRLITPQFSLFFALKTSNNDGHRYIRSLAEKGVRNFIITGNIRTLQHEFSNCNFIQVADAVVAMQQIAAAHREQFSIPVVGITGSNGKTIVKEWLSTMLAGEFNVVRNPNSYNSQIGVPFSVWQIEPEHNFAIFEAGISQPGEMSALEKVIKPTIGILTNIGSAHSQFFKNDEEKLHEKLKLFTNCRQLIFCADHLLVENTLKNPEFSEIEKISWGKSESAFYRITSQESIGDHTKIEINGQLIEIPFNDPASCENAMHCVALLLHLGYSNQFINKHLANLSAMYMRMELKEAVNDSILINDTYSIDFSSLRIAVNFLNQQKQYSRKSLILSDFEQAGELTGENCEEIATILKTNNFSRFIAVGDRFYANRQYFKEKLQIETFFFKKTGDLINQLPEIKFYREAILVKGARSYRFERVVERLLMRTHQTVLNVSLPAIIQNLNYYRSFLKPGCKMVAMVKAQSYGLGDAELINELQFHNIDYLAVAYGDEGVNLRRRNIKTPIIVLGAEAHSFDTLVKYDLEPEIFNFHYLKKLIDTLSFYPDIKQFKIHIKLDTGMHRLGFDEYNLPELIKMVKSEKRLRIASIFSHLAAAEDESEDDFTRGQIALFERMSSTIMSAFDYPILRHILNTAGITRFPEAQFDMVRLGIGLYGFSGVGADWGHLQNVATLKTIITQIKIVNPGETVGYNRSEKLDSYTKIGIIPIGYADGFFREFGCGRGRIYVKGKYARTIGKICMDMCMVDLSEIENVHVGDEAIVYGEENRIDDLAAAVGKIPYELLTSISRRVPRIYIME